MAKIEPIAIGKVESLCINGEPQEAVIFLHDGPVGDNHRGIIRTLSGHDGLYTKTSALEKGGGSSTGETGPRFQLRKFLKLNLI